MTFSSLQKRLVSYHQSSVGGKIKCGDTELQHVCMADTFMSLDHRAHLDGAIAFVCKDLVLAGKRVTFFIHFLQNMEITVSEEVVGGSV